MTPLLDDAKRLLATHPLAGVRLARWDPERSMLDLEVFHVEWPGTVFGTLSFLGVTYFQGPVWTSWGYSIRLGSFDALPSAFEREPSDVVFEIFSFDGSAPSVLLVAESMRARHPT